MGTKKITCALALLIMIVMPSASAFGQISFGQPSSGGTGLVYTSWKLSSDAGDATISQLWIPVDAYVPLKDNLEARVYLARGSTNLDEAGIESDIAGLSNLSVQLSQSLADDKYLISAGFDLPTGKKELDLGTQRRVLQSLAKSYLDFPLRRYGEGFGFNLLLGTARQMGEIMLSGGIMYKYSGSYEPYVGADDYDPGDNFNINASAETKRGDITYSATAVFASYSADQNNGVKVFKQGNHLNLIFGGRYADDGLAYGAQIRYFIRARNAWYDNSETVDERLKLYGNEFELSLNAAFELNKSWQLRPMASLRLIEKNERDIGKSHIISFGANAATSIGEKLSLAFGVKYLTGKADDDLYNFSLSGLQITTGLTTSF